MLSHTPLQNYTSKDDISLPRTGFDQSVRSIVNKDSGKLTKKAPGYMIPIKLFSERVCAPNLPSAGGRHLTEYVRKHQHRTEL